MSERFTLYGSPHSQFTYKVALMLRLCGAGFTFRYVSFQKQMHLTPEFHVLSRWRQVPVLTDGPRILVQSGAILEYLADAFGKFRGQDALERQQIREWLYWNADRMGPPVYGCYGVVLGRRNLLPIATDPVLAADHRKHAEAALAVLHSNLAPREFLVAPSPTIADICCYGETAFAQLCDFDLERWPNVAAWARRLATLPGFATPLDLLPMADADIA